MRIKEEVNEYTCLQDNMILFRSFFSFLTQLLRKEF